MGFDRPPRGTVFSSHKRKTCPRCGHPEDACACSKAAAAPSGPVRVCRETKGRKGKGVTVVRGLALQHEELKAIAKRLKQVCGSGGTVKGDTIEIQGDHRDRVVDELIRAGHDAKRAGG
ncbi:MAG: stress response translation initiation inhibitor YciH [Acidobacteria bacterium]|nr:stress response translation initiation inhibitor YciH [Acidobacteriota bacterium]NIM61896.1 stress response translation initiation inhibitor YciH [Acidobacteriota bacterium]NIO60390.1 stress response translation initiation inhibitor YciH [Acidobacteriota bacterium]NIQ31462.1 stress response translation initiation inhibitor YciH [Acidobacteriota bacterium]NIQ86706.1 stress response translation initiation inhibitor YciH [Acidobacteriota bacterium]